MLKTSLLVGLLVLAQGSWKTLTTTSSERWSWYPAMNTRTSDGKGTFRLRIDYTTAQRVDSLHTSKRQQFVVHVRCSDYGIHVDETAWFNESEERISVDSRLIHWPWSPIEPGTVYEAPARAICER